MDTARQVIRWIIPGLCFFIFWPAFVAVRFFVTGHRLTILSLSTDPGFQKILTILTPPILVALGALGIAFGFVLYQFYFWFYWGGLAVLRTGPQDKGLDILQGIDFDFEKKFGFPLDTKETKSWCPRDILCQSGWARLPVKSPETTRRIRKNWYLMECLWVHTLTMRREIKEASLLDRRAAFFADIFHSLGAARWAMILAFVFYVVYDLFMHEVAYLWPPSVQWRSEFVWPILVNGVIFLSTVMVLSSARRNTLEDLIAFRRGIFTSVYGLQD